MSCLQRSMRQSLRLKSCWIHNTTSMSMRKLAKDTSVSPFHATISSYLLNFVSTACDAYHVPAHVQSHIDLITPTVHFNAVIKRDMEGRKVGAANGSKKGPTSNKPKAIGTPGSGFNGPKKAGTTSLVSQDTSMCDTQVSFYLSLVANGCLFYPNLIDYTRLSACTLRS